MYKIILFFFKWFREHIAGPKDWKNWFVKAIMIQKLWYFGHIKRHIGLGRIVMKGVVPGRTGKGRPMRRLTQDIQEILGTRLHEARGLVTSRESFDREDIDVTCSCFMKKIFASSSWNVDVEGPEPSSRMRFRVVKMPHFPRDQGHYSKCNYYLVNKTSPAMLIWL